MPYVCRQNDKLEMVEEYWRCRIMKLLLSIGLPVLSPCHVACMPSLFLALGWRSYVTNTTSSHLMNSDSREYCHLHHASSCHIGSQLWHPDSKWHEGSLLTLTGAVVWCLDMLARFALAGHSRFLADGGPCEKVKTCENTAIQMVFKWYSLLPRYS